MITKATTFKGFSVPNAYYEIEKVRITKQDSKDGARYKVKARVAVYKDDTKKNRLETHTFSKDSVAETKCSITAIRAWLKTLDEFKIVK